MSTLGLLCLGVIIAYALLCIALHRWKFLRQRFASKSAKSIKESSILLNHRQDPFIDAGVVLLVTAHPDDECMFFGPTLLRLATSCDQIYLLCLSSGNFRGLGKVRKLELQNSCTKLGLEPSHVLIVAHTRLPDDSSARWDKRLVGKIVLRHIDLWNVNTLITFGRRGVSGHDNHRAIHRAVRHLYISQQLPSRCNAYTLDDVNVLRKYLGIFDVPLTRLLSKCVLVSTPLEVILAKDAMAAHQSQMVWFRKLYCIFSRYMVVNSLTPIFDSDNDFDDTDDDI